MSSSRVSREIVFVPTESLGLRVLKGGAVFVVGLLVGRYAFPVVSSTQAAFGIDAVFQRGYAEAVAWLQQHPEAHQPRIEDAGLLTGDVSHDRGVWSAWDEYVPGSASRSRLYGTRADAARPSMRRAPQPVRPPVRQPVRSASSSCVILTDADALMVQTAGVVLPLIGRVTETSAAYRVEMRQIEAVAFPRDGWELYTDRPIPLGCSLPQMPIRGLRARVRRG